MRQGLICHHTLGDRARDRSKDSASEGAAQGHTRQCRRRIGTRDRYVRGIHRLISPSWICTHHHRHANPALRLERFISTPVLKENSPVPTPRTRISLSKLQVLHHHLEAFRLVKTRTLFERLGLAYATTPMDKGLLSEEHPAFLGMYNSARSTPAALRGVVEDADLVVDFGGLVLED